MHDRRRLLIADRNRLVGEALSQVFGKSFDVSCNVLTNGLDLLATRETGHCDLILVDLCLPDYSGRQLIGELRLLDREVRIVAMSDHDGPGYRESLKGIGANGFFWKGLPLADFLDALASILEGRPWVAAPESFSPALPRCISDLEHQVLECLVQYPVKAIGRRLSITTRRVESLLQRLRRVFGVQSNPELVREAFRLGYIAVEAKSA